MSTTLRRYRELGKIFILKKRYENGYLEVKFVSSKENKAVDEDFIKSIHRIISENKEFLKAVGRL